MEIIDIHQHVGTQGDGLPKSAGRGVNRTVEEDVALRRQANASVGIDWAVLQPGFSYLRPDGIVDTMRVNDKIAGYRDYAPQDFPVVFGTTEPMHGERGLGEIDRIATELKLQGIAWHHRLSGCFIDSPLMWPIIERMGEHGLVPAFHCLPDSTMEAPWRLQRLARDFPDITFFAFVAFGTFDRASSILNTADQTPNIIWDIGGPANNLSIEDWVQRHGSSNICFSADIVFLGGEYAVPPARLQIEQANITDDDRRNIFSRNVRRAFRLPAQD